jgi:hypothetical protein
MSNQYKPALAYAAEDLRDLLNRYHVDVDIPARMIVWTGYAKRVPPGSTKRDCLRLLNKVISSAKACERQEQQKNQGTLL